MTKQSIALIGMVIIVVAMAAAAMKGASSVAKAMEAHNAVLNQYIAK